MLQEKLLSIVAMKLEVANPDTLNKSKTLAFQEFVDNLSLYIGTIRTGKF